MKKLLHDLFGWGFPDKRNGGNAVQQTYSCKYCDVSLVQDPQEPKSGWHHLQGEYYPPL